ncbi:MAG: alpha/beta hydrolase [Chloroflexia bacterium]
MKSNGKSKNGTISLLSSERKPAGPGYDSLTLRTDRGDIEGLLHAAGPAGTTGPSAVVWVGGAGGGTEGPAGHIYRTLAERLVPAGISSLRLDYRHPNVLVDCIADLLVALAWLEDLCGVKRAALVGHSFGGAVVIDAGALSPIVKLVVALSSQTYGADLVADVSPRSLLLVHGEADRVLPAICSRRLYDAAHDPRELVLYPGAGHGLTECAAELRELLWMRLVEQLG